MRHCYETQYIETSQIQSTQSYSCLKHRNLAFHIELINWVVLGSSHAKSVTAADLSTSLIPDAQLGIDPRLSIHQ